MTRWECNVCDVHCMLERERLGTPDECPFDEPDGSSWDLIKKGRKSDEEIRKRIDVLRETLANTYGKDMPYAEERLQARIDEDEWVLNFKRSTLARLQEEAPR